jgi:glycosyltransferase involved in cell wall biosynthesis
MQKPIKTLHIDASRLKSGGGVLHLIKLLELEKYSNFDKIIVYTYQNSEFEKFKSQKIIIKTCAYINKNIFYQIFWQRYLLKDQISPNDLLFTIDSTSFCKFKKNVILNQDLIGFQEGSLNYFSFKNKVISYIKYLVAKNAMKNSIANIFTTKFALDQVVKKIGSIKNANVIPHGIDSKFLTKKMNYDISESSLKVIYVSSVLDYKNHKYLISALNNLPSKKKVIAYFIGGGDSSLINKLKVQSENSKGNKFHFSGFLDREEVFDLTKSSDIAVFLSSVECFGITLLEYMRIGMPIICSKESSMPETLKDGGLLVSPFDEASIIKAITDFELNKNKRLRLGEKAYNNSIKYSWNNTAKETYSLLNKTYKEFANKNIKLN